jgi:AhpC/TSA family
LTLRIVERSIPAKFSIWSKALKQNWTLITCEAAHPLTVQLEAGRILVEPAVLEAATGWSTRPEGFCQGDVCVPAGKAVRDDGLVDLREFADRLGRPLVEEPEHAVAALGESARQRAENLQSLIAPDFELPDLTGRMHRLSDYRGKKVLLAAYASW